VHELTAVEMCAGAGGQALGLQQAGFRHEAVVEFTDCRTCACFWPGVLLREHVWDVAVPHLGNASATVPSYEERSGSTSSCIIRKAPSRA